MNKYKILHIITRFDKGGSAENTYLTLMGLDQDKYELSLIEGSSDIFRLSDQEKTAKKKNIETLRKKNIPVITVKNLVRNIKPITDFQALIILTYTIRKGNYHIVHTHTSKAGFIGRWAAFLARVPIIIHTPHGHVFDQYFGSFKTNIIIWLERLTGFITDKIITLTQKSKDDHAAFHIAPANKFTIIHSGVKTGNFTNSADNKKIKKKLSIPEKQLVVGTIGRLVEIKGHEYLIDAAKLVLDDIKDIQFIFLGDGHLKKDLIRKVNDLNLSENFQFLGWRDDVSQILSLFDLFVLPSLYEGMGKVLVEAMMQGKAIVASRVGGVPDLIEHEKNGFLVEPKNSKQLAKAIIFLLTNNEKRKSMGILGKKISMGYTAEKMVDKIDKLYDEKISDLFI